MSDPSGIDPQGLAILKRIGGADFVKQMIDLFLKEAPDRLQAAREGEKAGDLKAVTEATHSLQSSARQFGAVRLANLAGRIEIMTSENSSENLSGLLGDLERAYATARAWLESERDSLV